MEETIAEIEEVMSTADEDACFTMWELRSGAKALERANRLIDEREYYFESLYDDIRYFAVRYEDAPTLGSNPSVEYQACKIIDTKRAYNKRIEGLRDQYGRWREFLHTFDKRDAELLQRYFEDDDPIPNETIQRLLFKAKRKMERVEKDREKELNAQAMEEHKKFRQQNVDKFKAVTPPDNTNKKHVLVDGQFHYMTDEEYEAYQQAQTGRTLQLEATMDRARVWVNQ